VLLSEPECDAFIRLVVADDDPLISSVILVESSIALGTRAGEAGVRGPSTSSSPRLASAALPSISRGRSSPGRRLPGPERAGTRPA